MVNGRPIKLVGTELEAAEEQYGDDINDETDTLEELTNLRTELKTLEEKMTEATDEEEYEMLTKDYDEKMKKFKVIRYKDKRTYSNQMEVWKKSFHGTFN